MRPLAELRSQSVEVAARIKVIAGLTSITSSTTKSVSNYSSFDFFILNLTTSLIQKFVLNITSFAVAYFINKNSSRMT